MIYILEFNINNKVRTLDPIPVESQSVGMEFGHADGMLSSIRLIKRGVSIDFAPKITPATPSSLTNLEIPKNPYREVMLNRLRALQGIALPFIYLDIDFENPQETFRSEGDEDIPIESWSVSENDEARNDYFSYEILARSFLATADFGDHFEPSYFIVEGRRYLRQGLYVSAYNSFFLYLESLLGGGKFKVNDLVQRFRANRDLVDSVEDACRSGTLTENPTTFEIDSNELQKTIRNIVLHRGKLRHHSIDNSGRWLAMNQEKYRNDAYFLQQIVVQHLNVKSFGLVFDDARIKEYNEISRSVGNVANISVDFYLRHDDSNYRKQIQISLPQKTVDSSLATEAFLKAFETIRADIPQAKILQIRGFNMENGVEVFRYDLSPSTMF